MIPGHHRDWSDGSLLWWLAVLAVIGGVCLWVVFVTGCGKRDIPSTAPQPTLKVWVGVTGKSMLPTFPERTLVEAEIGVSFDDLKLNDTVIFWDYTKTPAAFTHHRLVSQQAGQWIARGDNEQTNTVADRPWVTKDNFIARTTGKFTQLLAAPRL